MGQTHIEAERTETALNLELTINRNGGVTGLTVLVAVRDGGTVNSWLDFADGTFKAAGWTTRQAAVAEVSAGSAPGEYRRLLDLSAITNLPASPARLVAEYDVSGSLVANASDLILLKDTVFAPAVAGDAMDLIVDAVDAAAVATSGAQEIRDEILADATPFAGADVAAILADTAAIQPLVDVATSSRESEASALARAASDISAHGTTQADIATVIATGGPGPWTTGAGVSDWTAPEREQFRDALGITGTKAAALGGQLQALGLQVRDVWEMTQLEIGQSKTMVKPTGDGLPNAGSITITRTAGADKVFELERGAGGDTLIVRRTA